MQMPKTSPNGTGVTAPAEGNARLTVATSVVLLVLFCVAVGTVLIGVKSHLTLHVMVGLMLVPPLAVKIASVSWRLIRYYRHDAEYRRKGPPAPLLRILGPALLAATLVLFASGITLLLAPGAFGGPRGVMFKIHDLSCYVWLLLILAHLAGHAGDLRRLALRDWGRRTRAAVPGALIRQSVALAALAAGLGLALSLVGHVSTEDPPTTRQGPHAGQAQHASRTLPGIYPGGRGFRRPQALRSSLPMTMHSILNNS